MTKADYTPEQLEQIEAALATATEMQRAFWDALCDLETAVGSRELDLDNNDLENYDLDDILGMIENDDEEEEERPIDFCRKCGKALTLENIDAYTDMGEGEEAGKVFVYCSAHCRDTH